MEPLHGGVALAREVAEVPTAVDDPATREAVFGLVYRQMRSLAGQRDVDDLVQVAAEQALRGLATFAGRSKLSTWTFRICYLTLLKHERWYRRWLQRFTLTDDGELGELPDPGADGPAGDDRLMREERGRCLQRALEGLSRNRRTVVVMHDLEGLSIDEIAEVVAARPRAVRSRLRDGRRALAQALAGDPYFGDEACGRRARRPKERR